MCNLKAGLAFLADQACLTPHLWLSRVGALDVPDQLVIDLDPPPDGEFALVREAARQCRSLLDELDLFAVAKTTGSRGVHIVVPLRPEEGFDRVRRFARGVARLLESRHPESLTTEQRKSRRRNRLYLDTGRNAYAQTAVAPYAVRALPGAPVATPIAWSELDDRHLDARAYSLANIDARLREEDPWSGWRRHAKRLDAARDRMAILDDERNGTRASA